MTDLDWRQYAACRGRDPEWWFAGPTSRETGWAKIICRGCPVREPCAAMGTQVSDGIWAGVPASGKVRDMSIYIRDDGRGRGLVDDRQLGLTP